MKHFEKTKLLIKGTSAQRRKIDMEDVNIKVCGESVKVTESEKLLRLVINGEGLIPRL